MRFVLIAALTIGLAGAAFAHGFDVRASVAGPDIVVEARFSSGKPPKQANVLFYDDNNTLVAERPLGPDGMLLIPMADLDTSTGLRIEVDAGNGHKDYWVLTPRDLSTEGGS